MNCNDYASRQAAKDAAYRREYETWVRSTSPEKRAKLKAAGLDVPLLPTNGTGLSDCDLADSSLASEEPDIAAEVDRHLECREDVPAAAEPDTIWEVIRRLIGELLVQRNAKLALECLALVSGVSFLGDSMTEIARRHRVTRAAVSKRCVELSEKLALPPARAMRTLTARKAYARARNRRLRVHD
jgi:hypothetical protein